MGLTGPSGSPGIPGSKGIPGALVCTLRVCRCTILSVGVFFLMCVRE